MWPYSGEEKAKQGVYSIENPYNECVQDLSIFSDKNRVAEHVLNIEVRAKPIDLKRDKVENSSKFIEPIDKRSLIISNDVKLNKKIPFKSSDHYESNDHLYHKSSDRDQNKSNSYDHKSLNGYHKSKDRDQNKFSSYDHHKSVNGYHKSDVKSSSNERLNENTFSDRSKKQKIETTYNVLSNIHKHKQTNSWNQSTARKTATFFTSSYNKNNFNKTPFNPNDPKFVKPTSNSSLSNDNRKSNQIINVDNSQTPSPHIFGIQNYDIRANSSNLPSNFKTTITTYNPNLEPSLITNPYVNQQSNIMVPINDPRTIPQPIIVQPTIVPPTIVQPTILQQTIVQPVRNILNKLDPRNRVVNDPRRINNYSRSSGVVNQQKQTNKEKSNKERTNKEETNKEETINVNKEIEQTDLTREIEKSNKILSIKEYKKIDTDDKPSAGGYDAIDNLLNGIKSSKSNQNKSSSNEKQSAKRVDERMQTDQRRYQIHDTELNENTPTRDCNMNLINVTSNGFSTNDKSINSNPISDHSYSRILNCNNLMECEPILNSRISEEIAKLSEDYRDEGEAIENEMRMILEG